MCDLAFDRIFNLISHNSDNSKSSNPLEYEKCIETINQLERYAKSFNHQQLGVLYNTLFEVLSDAGNKYNVFHSYVLWISVNNGLFKRFDSLGTLIFKLMTDITTTNCNIKKQLWSNVLNTIIYYAEEHLDLIMNEQRSKLYKIFKMSLTSKFDKALNEKILTLMVNVVPNLKEEVEYAEFLYETVIPVAFDNIDDYIRVAALDVGYQILSVVSKCNVNTKWEDTFKAQVVERYIPTCMSLALTEKIIFSNLWIFLLKALRTEAQNPTMTNHLLSVIEKGFKAHNHDMRKQAFLCWQALIDTTMINPKDNIQDKRIKLMVVPLKTNNCKTEELIRVKFETWCKLIDVLDTKVVNYSHVVLDPFLYFCFGPLGETPFISHRQSMTIAAPGKKYQSLHYDVCASLLILIGNVNFNENLFTKFHQLKHNRQISFSIFKQISKFVIFSVGECSVMLCGLDHQDATAMNDCLWKSLFEYIENYVADENILSNLIAIILALIELSKTIPKILRFCLNPVFKSITLCTYEFCKLEFMKINFYISLAIALCSHEDITPDDVRDIFEQIFVFSNISFDFVISTLDEMSGSVVKSATVATIHNLCMLWCCLHKSVCNQLTTQTTKSNSGSDVAITCGKLLLWPVMYMHQCDQDIFSKWCTIYELCLESFESESIMNMFSKQLSHEIVSTMEKNFLTLLTVTKCLCHILKHMKIAVITEDNCVDICLFDSLSRILSVSLVHDPEVLNEFDVLISSLFEFCSKVKVTPKILQHLTDCLKHVLKRRKNENVMSLANEFINAIVLDEENKSLIEEMKTLCQSPLISSETQSSNKKVKTRGGMLTKKFKPKKTPKIIIKPVLPKNGEDSKDEYVIIESQYEFDPKKLTKHQKEKLKCRRDDIPALYQDLSQSLDFSSNSESLLKENVIETNCKLEQSTEPELMSIAPFSELNNKLETEKNNSKKKYSKKSKKPNESAELLNKSEEKIHNENDSNKNVAENNLKPKKLSKLEKELKHIVIDMVGCDRHLKNVSVSEKRKTRPKSSNSDLLTVDSIFNKSVSESDRRTSFRKKPDKDSDKTDEKKQDNSKISNEPESKINTKSRNLKPEDSVETVSGFSGLRDFSLPVLYAFETIKPGESIEIKDGMEKIGLMKSLGSSSPFKVVSPNTVSKLASTSDKDTETLEICSNELVENSTSEIMKPSVNVCRKVLFDNSMDSESILSDACTPTVNMVAEIDTSPLQNDTPTRNKELLTNTLDLSPIRADENPEEQNIFHASKETQNPEEIDEFVIHKKHSSILSGRGAQMMDLVSAPMNSSTISKQDTPTSGKKFSSSSDEYCKLSMHSRIQKIINNLEVEDNEETTKEDEDTQKWDMFSFQRDLPLPSASPSFSILRKRKHPDTTEENDSPCTKRKRVNFADPPVSSKKIIESNSRNRMKTRNQKENQFNMLDANDKLDMVSTDTLEDTGNENELFPENDTITDEVEYDKYDDVLPVCSALVDSKEPISNIISELAYPNSIESICMLLKNNSITTIGGLAQLTELDLFRIPLKLNKVRTVLNKHKALVIPKNTRKFKARIMSNKKQKICPSKQDNLIENKNDAKSKENENETQFSEKQPDYFQFSADVIPSTFDTVQMPEIPCATKESEIEQTEDTLVISVPELPEEEIIVKTVQEPSVTVHSSEKQVVSPVTAENDSKIIVEEMSSSTSPVAILSKASPSSAFKLNKVGPTLKFSPKMLGSSASPSNEDVLSEELSERLRGIIEEIITFFNNTQCESKSILRTLYDDMKTAINLLASFRIVRVHHLADVQNWENIISDIISHIGIQNMMEHMSKLKNVQNSVMIDLFLKYNISDISTEFICERLELKKLLKYVYRVHDLKNILTDFDTVVVCDTLFDLATDQSYSEFRYREVLQEKCWIMIKTPEDVFHSMKNLTLVEVFDVFVRRMQNTEIDSFLQKLYDTHKEKYLKQVTKSTNSRNSVIKNNWTEQVDNLINNLDEIPKNLQIRLMQMLAQKLNQVELIDLFCSEIKTKALVSENT